MELEKVWKEMKSFKKELQIADFENILLKIGYKELAYKSIVNKKGEIIRRKLLVISPSNRIEEIVLGKKMNILSIFSK